MTGEATMGFRYRLLMVMCKALRHPAKRFDLADGGSFTTCPCGTVRIRVGPLTVWR